MEQALSAVAWRRTGGVQKSGKGSRAEICRLSPKISLTVWLNSPTNLDQLTWSNSICWFDYVFGCMLRSGFRSFNKHHGALDARCKRQQQTTSSFSLSCLDVVVSFWKVNINIGSIRRCLEGIEMKMLKATSSRGWKQKPLQRNFEDFSKRSNFPDTCPCNRRFNMTTLMSLSDWN